MRTVVGLFEDYHDADNAIDMLHTRGFDHNAISVVAREAYVREHLQHEHVGVTAGEGAAGGAAVGGLAGLLAGIGALVVPGVGPVITAGTLAAALGVTAVGAGVGAVTGGLLGALMEAGVPEADAHFYAEGVKRGGVLVTVQTEDQRASEAEKILLGANAIDVERRRQAWQEQGWSRYDEKTKVGKDYPRL
jgi:hypothetical protein